MTAKTQSSPNRQRGFTIVEFLIAGTLGLLLLGGVGLVFVGANDAFRTQRQVANVQDNGRFALFFLQNEIMQAGFAIDTPPSSFAKQMLNDPFGLNALVGSICGAATPCATNGAGTNSDSFAVRYTGTVDCTGAAVAGGVVENRFFVDQDAQQLMCQGNGGGPAQPLAAGVANMQILYGVPINQATREPSRFLTADQAAAVPVPTEYRVKAVRLSLLLVGDADTLPAAVADPYVLEDVSIVFDDLRMRRVMSLAIPVANAKFDG